MSAVLFLFFPPISNPTDCDSIKFKTLNESHMRQFKKYIYTYDSNSMLLIEAIFNLGTLIDY